MSLSINREDEFGELYPEIDINAIKIAQPDVNRPALQLAGFYDHFDSERVQVIGHVNGHICNKWVRKMPLKL